MSDDWVIHQTTRRRRIGGWLLLPIAVLLAGFWIWLISLDRAFLAEPVVALPAIGLMALSLWAVLAPTTLRPRLGFGAEAITVWGLSPDDPLVIIPWGALDHIAFKGIGNTRRVIVAGAGETVQMNVAVLEVGEREILRRARLRVESLGMTLVEDTSPVLGAATGVWRIIDQAPFD